MGDLPFRSLYVLDDEFAAEIVNANVHGVMHLGWVEDGVGGYRGQMAVLVKPNGLLGRAYMVGIKPLRYLFVLSGLMRNYARRWQVIGPQCPPVGTVTSLVGVEHVPVPMRRIGPAEVDYADVFTLTADVVATPEQWARTLFDDVAGVGGQRLWRWLRRVS